MSRRTLHTGDNAEVAVPGSTTTATKAATAETVIIAVVPTKITQGDVQNGLVRATRTPAMAWNQHSQGLTVAGNGRHRPAGFGEIRVRCHN